MERNGKYLLEKDIAMAQKINSLWLASLSFFSLQAHQDSSIITKAPDDKNMAIDITIPITQGQYLYADQIQITANNPAVGLSSWKSSIEPVMEYDSIYKQNRKIIKQTPTIHLKATKLSDQELPEVHLRLVYYTNKAKTATEKLFPLHFQMQKPITPSAQPVVENKAADETTTKAEQPAQVAEKGNLVA